MAQHPTEQPFQVEADWSPSAHIQNLKYAFFMISLKHKKDLVIDKKKKKKKKT